MVTPWISLGGGGEGGPGPPPSPQPFLLPHTSLGAKLTLSFIDGFEVDGFMRQKPKETRLCPPNRRLSRPVVPPATYRKFRDSPIFSQLPLPHDGVAHDCPRKTGT